MRFLLTSILGCFCLASCLTVASALDIKKLEGFYWENRPMLGHLKEEPFIGLYENYAASFIKPLYPDRDLDDFRNYLPSADECMVFFSSFRIDKYKLRDVDQMVVLDACLGYLYESEYQEKDSEVSEQVKENLKVWLQDEQLRSLYQQTRVNELNWEAKKCVGRLLLESIYARHQFPDKVCDHEWIKVYLNFAKCHRNIPAEQRETDSYLNILYELVKIRGHECFYHQIKILNGAVRANYANNVFYRAHSKMSFQVTLAQSNERMWPKPIVKLLKAVQNPSEGKTVNLRQVGRLIRGVKLGKDVPFLANIANYSTYQVVHKKFSMLPLKANPDPSGSRRYLELVDDLCHFFRPNDNPRFYDYTTPFVRMVKMLEYPEVFDINERIFSRDVINHSYESGTLFFAVSSCNLLTYTQGQFKSKPQNGFDEYEVMFKPDTSKMVVWPDTGFW